MNSRFDLATVILLIAPLWLFAQPHNDLPKALATAKAQDKPVFIYVYDSI